MFNSLLLLFIPFFFPAIVYYIYVALIPLPHSTEGGLDFLELYTSDYVAKPAFRYWATNSV